MKPQLNRMIVWDEDRRAAEFFSEITGMGLPTEFGHFTQVESGNGVTLDLADTNGDQRGLHLAFLVTQRQYDEIFGRIMDKELPHWADPRRTQPGRINHHDGGRGVHFSDPHSDVRWEIITRPCGSGPDERPTNE